MLLASSVPVPVGVIPLVRPAISPLPGEPARHTWSAGDIRRVFEERTTSAGQDSNNVLAELLQTDEDPDADEFWQLVETNLRAARLRLLFVADGIPDELTRVVEFLNEQMPGIEVLAVEIKQFLVHSQP